MYHITKLNVFSKWKAPENVRKTLIRKQKQDRNKRFLLVVSGGTMWGDSMYYNKPHLPLDETG